jgi:hypothetical protein
VKGVTFLLSILFGCTYFHVHCALMSMGDLHNNLDLVLGGLCVRCSWKFVPHGGTRHLVCIEPNLVLVLSCAPGIR